MKSIKTFLVLFLATLIAVPTLAMAKDNKRKHKNPGDTSVFISFANAGMNPNLDDSFLVNLGFDNSDNQYPFIMDTGSCGIVASKDVFTPSPDAQNLGPGSTHYTDGSFERILTGTYYTATQQIYDQKGNLKATSNVPVLRVDAGTQDGKPIIPTKTAVMGIGFGREGDSLPPKTPSFNPFLNLSLIRVDGKLIRPPKNFIFGYVISANGVELGITVKNTKGAGFIKLEYFTQYATPELPEWNPMPVTVVVNGVPGNGTSVMDTGITQGIVNPSPAADLGTLVLCPDSSMSATPVCLPDRDVISVYYPNNVNPVAYYTFILGQAGNPMEPPSVAKQTRSSIYWNTSRHLIGGMNYVFDNTNGYVGFIWNHNTSNQFGYVIPTD